MKRKKCDLLSLLFGMVLVVSLALTGCGKQAAPVQETVLVEETGETASPEETTQPEEPDSHGELTVTIYATNDIHGVVEEGEETIGMARVAGIAASTENSLLVDAGDATQGVSFATVTQGQDVIRMMNAAGYDVMATGNHEYDYGEERLLSNVASAEFPVLGANVMKDGSPLLQESAVIDVEGRKIAFIGLTTTYTASSVNPAGIRDITFADEVQTAKEQIAKLRDEADAIVLVCHMGDVDYDVDCTSGKLLDALDESERSEVTAVIDGHSHTMEEGTYGSTGIAVVQTGTHSVALGVVTINFNAEGNVSADSRLMDYEEVMNFQLTAEGEAAMQVVTDTLSQIQGQQEGILGQLLCLNDTPLWGGYIYYDYAEPRVVETSFGDFVTDAFAYGAKELAGELGLELPIVAVENGGGIGSTLPYGDVTRGDVLDAFNHGNVVPVLKITPAQLYEALEGGLVVTGQDETGLLLREKVSGSFLQVSGFAYSYDPAGEAGAKVTEIVLDDGTALEREDQTSYLLLATNNYVAEFEAFAGAEKVGELGGEDLVVENYILAQTDDGAEPLSMPVTANRIRIANDRSPSTYKVDIPVFEAESKVEEGEEPPYLANLTVHLRIDDADAVEYVTDAEGYLHLTLEKGAHTIYMVESTNQVPVYVNNYSGSGTACTAAGYYRLGFAGALEQ